MKRDRPNDYIPGWYAQPVSNPTAMPEEGEPRKPLQNASRYERKRARERMREAYAEEFGAPDAAEAKSTALALTPFRLFQKKCREYQPGVSDEQIDEWWRKRPPSFEQKLLDVIRSAEEQGYEEKDL